MRHRRKGRKLGRSPSHQRALLRNLASALLLTERDAEQDDNAPKVKGRIVTTLHKAKEVRPLVEKCVTIARRSIPAQEDAQRFDTDAERNSSEWRRWRESDEYRQWNQAMAPVVAARRRALQLLGDKQAVQILFDDVAPRFANRDGGYTRIVRLAKPRLGDAGTRVILEFVGVRDRVIERSEAPAFESDNEPDEVAETAQTQAAAESGGALSRAGRRDRTRVAGVGTPVRPRGLAWKDLAYNVSSAGDRLLSRRGWRRWRNAWRG